MRDFCRKREERRLRIGSREEGDVHVPGDDRVRRRDQRERRERRERRVKGERIKRVSQGLRNIGQREIDTDQREGRREKGFSFSPVQVQKRDGEER